MKTYRLALIGFAMLALGVWAGNVVFNWYHSEYLVRLEQCKQVELGASEGEVTRLLGNPGRNRLGNWKGRKVRFLEYDAPAVFATAPSVVIDEQLDQVAAITCDDAYHHDVQELK